MQHVALMTFHASHNFGSVFQAYALKSRIEQMGYNCDILNFRPIAQIDKYSLIPKMYGAKAVLKRLARFPQFPQLKRSHERYESFICERLTKAEPFSDIVGFETLPDYDVYVTGSDQVWGYAIPEFVKSTVDIRSAYYLDFAHGKKISYASSTGEATAAQLAQYASLLDKYSRISVRENRSREIVRELTGREAVCCLDPTFLISKDQYCSLAAEADVAQGLGEYVLIYSLQGYRLQRDWLAFADAACERLGMPAVSVSPFCPKKTKLITPIHDAGPMEILALFANASYVLTDTFHGTLFSTHFEKQFITFEPGRDDPRMRDALERLGLMDRVAHGVEEAVSLTDQLFDYGDAQNRRMTEVSHSVAYLEEALRC